MTNAIVVIANGITVVVAAPIPAAIRAAAVERAEHTPVRAVDAYSPQPDGFEGLGLFAG